MPSLPEGLFRVTGCRACDEGRYLCFEHQGDCEHDNRDEEGRYFDPQLCLDCGNFVGLIGPGTPIVGSSVSYVCKTCGIDRQAIYLETQECPDCKATRLGHCLCTSDPGHPNDPCDRPATEDGYCGSCASFRANND